MTAHELARLLLAGPNLPVTTKQGVYGLIEINHVRSNWNNRNKRDPWCDADPGGEYHYDEDALVIETT